MFRFTRAAAVAAVLLAAQLQPAVQAADVDLDAYVRKDRFETLKVSPRGDYFAATVPLEDRTVLVVMSRADNKITGTFSNGRNTHVVDFWWANDERVVMAAAEKFGALDQPQSTGEIYAINADGSGAELLVGQRASGSGVGTRIQVKKAELVVAFPVDMLDDDDRNILISVHPFNADPYTRAERLDIYSGRRTTVARAPVRNARFVTDNRGVVRFALGAGVDLVNKLYYRGGEGGEWKLLNDEAVTLRTETPVGFSEDDRTAYLMVEKDQGPDAIVAMDVASGARNEVLRDDNTDPLSVIHRPGTGIPVGAMFMDGKPRTAFFDDKSAEARLYRSLEAAFAGEAPFITSSTADGKLALVQVGSDRNPGDFYLFDIAAKKANHIISRREWFDPTAMAEVRPVAFKARDGLDLHGYLTVPKGVDAKALPVVVMPHGGPFGIFDAWGFDSDVQMLAEAGYAVLQVNFRGSGNHGRAFERAGAKQWGLAMQDDVTDGTRWAIAQGIADPRRICIYGASYGAYASLMGVAKEPDLYRCAVGYVGVYDLPTMHNHGDIQEFGSGETYLKDWLGAKAELDKASPNRMAERIKVPVFLAAGGEDRRAPIEHSKLMERALVAAGVPVEVLYYPNEGHGFYVEAHRREYYQRMLAFLGRHIGASAAEAQISALDGRGPAL